MQSGNTYLHSMKCVTQGSLAYVAIQVSKFDICFSLLTLPSDSVFVKFIICVFAYWHSHRLWRLLSYYSWLVGGSQGKWGSDWPDDMVDVVCDLPSTLSSKLTPVIVGFFQILLHHSALSAKIVHCQRFGKNVLPCRNKLWWMPINCLFS